MSTAGALLGGAVVAAFGYVTERVRSSQALELAGLERREAQRARLHADRVDAYRAALFVANAVREHGATTLPIVQFGSSPAEPAVRLPSVEEQVKRGIALNLFGAARVREAYRELRAAFVGFDGAAMVMRTMLDQRPGGEQERVARMELEAARTRLYDAVAAVEDAVNEDLVA